MQPPLKPVGNLTFRVRIITAFHPFSHLREENKPLRNVRIWPLNQGVGDKPVTMVRMLRNSENNVFLRVKPVYSLFYVGFGTRITPE